MQGYSPAFVVGDEVTVLPNIRLAILGHAISQLLVPKNGVVVDTESSHDMRMGNMVLMYRIRLDNGTEIRCTRHALTLRDNKVE